jgi:hypothetical protein
MGLLLAALGTSSCSGKVITEGSGGADGSAGAPAKSVPEHASENAGSDTAGPDHIAPSAGGAGPAWPSAGGTAPTGPSAGGTASGYPSQSVAGAASVVAGFGGSFVNTGGPLLLPIDGWVDRASNELQIQGAVYAYADSTSAMSMTADFTGSNACIQGTAAKVDQTSQQCLTKVFTPPALDCYGEFWGAAIGMNLNQPIDSVTMMAREPAPFNASALKGFAFQISGSAVPAPKDLRFQVESADGQMFCNVPTTKIKLGDNFVRFSDLVSECFRSPAPTQPSAESAQSSLLRLSWHVLTNTWSEVPYDFCVSDIRAILK